jgi:hypothetical protein
MKRIKIMEFKKSHSTRLVLQLLGRPPSARYPCRVALGVSVPCGFNDDVKDVEA